MATHSVSMELELLDTVEAAKFIGFSVDTLTNWRSRGIGPTYCKIGPGLRSSVRYRRTDLEEWIKNLPKVVPSVARNIREGQEGRA